MRRSVALLAVLGTAAATLACGSSRDDRPARAAPSFDVAAARTLYVRTGCGDCHALADAHVQGGSGPDFDSSERLNRRQLLAGMVEGANGMPSYAHRLTVAQRRLLADYLLRVGWGGAHGFAGG